MISTGCASAIKNLSVLTAHEVTKVELDFAVRDTMTNHILCKLDEIKLNDSGILNEIESVIHVSFDFDIEAMFPSISKDVRLQQCRKHLIQDTIRHCIMLTYNSLENIRWIILKQQVYYKNYIKIQPERAR